jgi:two-component system phosphate regulon sensor histidine kinase PhoR
MGLIAVALTLAAAFLAYHGQTAAAFALGAGALIGAAAMFYRLRGEGKPAGDRSARDATGTYDAVAQDVIASLDLPAVLIDAEGKVRAFNPPAQAIFPQLAPGAPIHQVSRNPGLLDAVEAARGDGLPHSNEVAERGPQGRRLITTVSPLTRDPPGQATPRHTSRYLIQLRDVSERDRLAQLRSDFIANASHELRTPLASVKGFIETLQGPAANDEKARSRFLGIMAAQSARMARILDDLLSLSRIEMKAHVPPTDKVDLNIAVRRAVHALEPIADDAKITLTLQVAEHDPAVRGDEDELEQVFQNLIENAIKYGHEGGKVEVTVARRASRPGRPGRIAVTVRDDGPGIAEEHVPRLTERFYRVDTATSRERGGTGLGLAIVKHILNRHGGELEISSEVGKGSTFTVTLNAES